MYATALVQTMERAGRPLVVKTRAQMTTSDFLRQRLRTLYLFRRGTVVWLTQMGIRL